MTYKMGTNAADTEYMSNWGAPVAPTVGHSYEALDGNDTVYGSSYSDLIQGGNGDDTLYGNGGNDALIGQQGSDNLYGGDGNDHLHGGSEDAGSDLLNGGAGDDSMSGSLGDDLYVHTLNGGVDTINDGKSEGGQSGYGGGNDIIQFTGIALAEWAELAAYRPEGSNDLWLSSQSDFSDGVMNDGVVIEDFYLTDANTFIEWAYTSANQWVDLWQLI